MCSPVYTDLYAIYDFTIKRVEIKTQKGSEYPYFVGGVAVVVVVAVDARITRIPISKVICNTKPETLHFLLLFFVFAEPY